MRTCDAVATAALLDLPALIEAVAVAAIEYAEGSIVCPARLVVPMDDETVMLSMPAVARDLSVHKLITIAPRNRDRGRATLQGQLTVFDSASGDPLLALDGPTVTGHRTAAISMLAIRLLSARRDGAILLIGTGVQARHHVDAIAATFPGMRIRVRGTSIDAARRFCASFDRIDVEAARDDEEADIVVTCTTSRTPVHRQEARPGTLIVATGSFRPEAAEIAPDTVRASALHVDDPVGAPHEAGDLIQAHVDWTSVVPLARLVRGDAVPASGPALFKSVGCAAWDLAAARVALRGSPQPADR